MKKVNRLPAAIVDNFVVSQNMKLYETRLPSIDRFAKLNNGNRNNGQWRAVVYIGNKGISGFLPLSWLVSLNKSAMTAE